MSKITVKQMVQIALLIACEIILTRFCAISTPIVRIGFGFLPIAIIGMLYGPWWAGGAYMLSDFIGVMLFPTAGAYFPGFTLTAFLTGFTYGFLLYRKDQLWRVIVAVGAISLLLNLCLDTLWIQIITGKGYLALLPVRILKCVIMAPVQVLLIKTVGVKICRMAVGAGGQAANS